MLEYLQWTICEVRINVRLSLVKVKGQIGGGFSVSAFRESVL